MVGRSQLTLSLGIKQGEVNLGKINNLVGGQIHTHHLAVSQLAVICHTHQVVVADTPFLVRSSLSSGVASFARQLIATTSQHVTFRDSKFML